MCSDLNFEYWVITTTDRWDALDFHKAWLNSDYPMNKGLVIKTLKSQLLWYETNSYDKEKAKAREILTKLSDDLKRNGRLSKFWNDYDMYHEDVSINDKYENHEEQIMHSNFILKEMIAKLEIENEEYARANLVLADLLNDNIKEKKILTDKVLNLEKELVSLLSKDMIKFQNGHPSENQGIYTQSK
ncbi:9644_t:CDS:2 [Dentiscutata heterogama]|uniref:9644_t:CDS:1 n=1 Tax=Dentiscutata heterogama TaxID=1316150 RepID=A0ACA9K6T5_9GLOM|nr:9644_t:CDS:2 [Dentiscutata heterogama]